MCVLLYRSQKYSYVDCGRTKYSYARSTGSGLGEPVPAIRPSRLSYKNVENDVQWVKQSGVGPG